MGVFGAGVASADVVSLSPTKDNTMYEYAAMAGDLSNGIGAHIFAGNNGNGEARRALVAFDLAAVPPGSRVLMVTLRMTMTMSNAGDIPISLHRMAGNWGEGTSDASGQEGGGAVAKPGDATWRHSNFPGTLWGTQGGDFAPAASATLRVGGVGSYTWCSTDGLVADVQAWVNAPTTNFGWVAIGDESVPVTAKRFDSVQSPAPANWPVLTVSFSPPPSVCGSSDFDSDGDSGTDLDIEAFFACLGGSCCCTCGSADFDGDGDTGTDLDIEAFFAVLGGGTC